MANNELDKILEEIRKKNQETRDSAAQRKSDDIPVEVVDTNPAPAVENADDIFSDILKSIESSEKAPAQPAEPEEPQVTYYPLDNGTPAAEAPDTPQPEAAVPETEAASAEEAAPESIFTFVNDTAPAEPSAEAAEAPEAEAPEAEAPLGTGNDPLNEEAIGFVSAAAANDSTPEEEDAADEDDGDGNGNGKKKPLLIALICLIIIAALVGVYFGFFYGKDKTPDTTESKPAASEIVSAEPVTQADGGIVNPFTGLPGYNEAAIGKRPAAVVVENEYSTKAIRPQWGIEDADMIMEGETEYSTRMLFFWADYTHMPEKIGPTRSARPPFIRFSQLFDAVFIHAGLSHSKDNYVGADTVFTNENIDHINLLSLEENGTYFGRSKERTSTIEHTGYLNGTNAAQLIEKQGFRTDLDAKRFTQFEFNKDVTAPGTMDAGIVRFTWSNACPKHAKFTYIDSEGIYRTSDFDESGREADLQFETLIMLLDQTEYIVKQNYKGSGNSETYCDYKLAGGKGLIASEGKATEITWSVEDGKLVMKDSNGNPVKLNPGKIYIGYGSSNHGGSYTAESKQSSEDSNN